MTGPVPVPDAGLDLWVHTEDGDSCGACLTDLERQAANHRVVAAIRHEIVRRTLGDVPPDDQEIALIGFAVAFPPAASSTAVREAEPSVPAATGAEGPEEKLRVALTAAFIAGDPVEVRLDRYRELQDALIKALPADGWSRPAGEIGNGTYLSGGGFDERLPLELVQRAGTAVRDSVDS